MWKKRGIARVCVIEREGFPIWRVCCGPVTCVSSLRSPNPPPPTLTLLATTTTVIMGGRETEIGGPVWVDMRVGESAGQGNTASSVVTTSPRRCCPAALAVALVAVVVGVVAVWGLLEALDNNDLDGGSDGGTVDNAMVLGLLLSNGTYTRDISITSDNEMLAMMPVLEAVREVRGNISLTSAALNVPPPMGRLHTVLGSLIINGTRIVDLEGAFPALRRVIGSFVVYANHDLTRVGPTAFAALESVEGSDFSLRYNFGVTTIAGCFPSLRETTGNLQVGSLTAMTAANAMEHSFPVLESAAWVQIRAIRTPSLNGSFPMLRTISQQLILTYNMGTIVGGFAALETVARGININNNAFAEIGTAFRRLTSAGTGLQVYTNFAGFCSSYAPRLCPAATVWVGSVLGDASADAADTCCTAFCASSPDC